jgi:hypothetical protein
MVYRDGRPGFVYLASHPDGLLKIGFTVNLRKRLEDLSRGTDTPLYVSRKPLSLEWVCVGLNYQAEQEIHQLFSAHRFGTKRSEWYRDNEEIRSYFAAIGQREYRRMRREKGLDK